MPRFRDTTERTVNVPVVLVVGSAELTERCREVVRSPRATPAHVKECDLTMAATMVARWRPLAIVLTEDLYAFDATEFDALAKDVKSMLVRVQRERVTAAQLEPMLLPALERYWRTQSGR
jgi:hypothetical protein